MYYTIHTLINPFAYCLLFETSHHIVRYFIALCSKSKCDQVSFYPISFFAGVEIYRLCLSTISVVSFAFQYTNMKIHAVQTAISELIILLMWKLKSTVALLLSFQGEFFHVNLLTL